MLTTAFKALLSAGVWARAASADRTDPEDVGLDRATGWPLAYEQRGSGKRPEREVFNQRDHEIDSGLVDVANYGVLPWDGEVSYAHTAAAAVFVTTPTGLHVSLRSSGPAHGGAVNPDTGGQTAWRRY